MFYEHSHILYILKKNVIFSPEIVYFRPRPIYHEVIMNVSWPYYYKAREIIFFHVKKKFHQFLRNVVY